MRFLKSPVFYLVGSNLVFWGLPLLWIQFRGSTALESPMPSPSASRVASVVLQEPELMPAVPPVAVEPTRAEPVPVASVPMPPVVPRSAPVASTLPEPALRVEPPMNLMKELRSAAGLGGPITLKSLKEPMMPIAARVERLQQKRSGDSLAALPRHWRESLRQELPAAKPVSEAAVVRLPVPALKQRQEVPVIVNERGEGEALVAPEDRRVRQAVESWAARQAAASPGTVQVYVVAAEPLSAE